MTGATAETGRRRDDRRRRRTAPAATPATRSHRLPAKHRSEDDDGREHQHRELVEQSAQLGHRAPPTAPAANHDTRRTRARSRAKPRSRRPSTTWPCCSALCPAGVDRAGTVVADPLREPQAADAAAVGAKQPLMVFRGVTAGGKSATFTLVGEAILHGKALPAERDPVRGDRPEAGQMRAARIPRSRTAASGHLRTAGRQHRRSEGLRGLGHSSSPGRVARRAAKLLRDAGSRELRPALLLAAGRAGLRRPRTAFAGPRTRGRSRRAHQPLSAQQISLEPWRSV